MKKYKIRICNEKNTTIFFLVGTFSSMNEILFFIQKVCSGLLIFHIINNITIEEEK